MAEPPVKRTVAFFDGQNLFHAAKEAFGHRFPTYDVDALARAICARKGWSLTQTRFYTGIPTEADNDFWNRFWTSKLGQMGRDGVWTFTRPLRYRNETIDVPGFGEFTRLTASEKGIDVRIALDIVGLARRGVYDVALVFSQDQDLSEVAMEIREIAKEQCRWIKMASAFPNSALSRNGRGINGTDWVKIPRAEYDACQDPRDYRPKKP
jgi:uncharacterized LabA/DUF88 family protein